LSGDRRRRGRANGECRFIGAGKAEPWFVGGVRSNDLVRAGFYGAHQVVRGRAIPLVRVILARTIIF